MLKITIELENLDKVLKALDDTGRILENVYPELVEISEYLMLFFTRDVFETEGGVYGDKWQPLSNKYDAWKNKHYPGRGVLERTSTLRYGFSPTVSYDYLVITNSVPYAKQLQEGTSRMPARVIMKLDDERKAIIKKMLIEGLMERVRKASI